MYTKSKIFLYQPHVFKRLYGVQMNNNIWQKIRKAPTNTQLIGGLASLTLGALVAYGLSQPANYVPVNTRILMNQFGGQSYSQKIRKRIMKTYSFLTLGLGITASVAIFANRKGFSLYMTQMNPLLLMGLSVVSTLGSMMITTSIPYENPTKIIWWSIFNSCVGISLVPMGMLGGAIISQAAMITGCILGSLSVVAAISPGDTFLSLGPILGCGLGVLIASSLGQVFFPASSWLMNTTLYGGLGLFGLYICYDTQKMLYHAQMDKKYDPINREIGIYMNTINIFIRIAQILAVSGNRKR